MGQSYRIRTEIGTNKTINVQLDQDFEFLEILSLKLRQVDVYNRDCSNYGVLVGRVTANNGFGVPNAKVSIFIPIETVDESNPIITSIYPYKSPEDKNEDGYRYNLLPYEKSYSVHAATGTFPSRTDALGNETAIEIYDKYYKLTSKTNDSGDYMIMGAPLGLQTIVMDIDLSDIGEFSLSPQDLIRLGIATESQVAGNTFKTSSDLNSLPQLINVVKTVDISPLWGDEDICQVAINRLDFDLRDDANVDIRPTSVFMGSMFSSPENMRVRPGFSLFGVELLGSARPKDNLGNLCNLVAGPGQILCIRQTVFQDQDGNPILEEHRLEQSGNVIDGDGTWLTELPMNLDYVVTNEFGEKVISTDPSIGIPTKAKYRFKIKWQQPPTLTEQTRRAYYLVPNIKEYGWNNFTDCDPNIEYTQGPCTSIITNPNREKLKSSYYFGLDWSGYTQGFTNTEKNNRLEEIINCEDTFYEFKYNKVYTVSNLIDQWKRGGRGRFIGIKEIDDDQCSSTINKFPVNEGFQNFDFLFFLFSIFMTIISFWVIPVLILAHILLFLYYIVIRALCFLCNEVEIFNYRPFAGLCTTLGINCSRDLFTIRLPMITYPECTTCECKTGDLTRENLGGGTNGVLSYVSFPGSYATKLLDWVEANSKPEGNQIFPENNDTTTEFSVMFAQAMSGNDDLNKTKNLFKIPISTKLKVRSDDGDEDDEDWSFVYSTSLPLGERINLFNGRYAYFSGVNRIKVNFDTILNPTTFVNSSEFHYDNTITVLANQVFNPGDLLTSVDITTSSDINFIFTASTTTGVTQGISGTSVTGATQILVKYADPNNTYNEFGTIYNISTGTTLTRQQYPMDREYFQVITAVTISQAISLGWDTTNSQYFPNILNASSNFVQTEKDRGVDDYDVKITTSLKPIEYFDEIENQYILILQRGVDPYSPKVINKYALGKIFGYNTEETPGFVVTASTRLNVPIQKLPTIPYDISVQKFVKQDMYYQSNFFTPGDDFSGFTSWSVGFYGELDEDNQPPGLNFLGITQITSSFLTNEVFANPLVGNVLVNSFFSDPVKYGLSEDLSGGSCMFFKPDDDSYNDSYGYYASETLYDPTKTDNNKRLTFDVASKQYNILRTDRLPSSDQINGFDWNQTALLQQNNNFKFYVVPEVGENTVIPTYTLGAEQVTQSIEGQVGATRVIESFDCEKMVSLDCYEGFGDNFRINQKCTEKDNVEKGCYLLLRRPLIDLFNGKDFKTYGEWTLRFRFFYGLCRGVLSQSFTNNWINGALFAFPIQVNTTYDSQNKPKSKFAKELIYFDQETTNFYYRSSPYNAVTKKFVGKQSQPSGLFNISTSVNDKNLLFPTTIMDLGMKEKFYSEIIYEPYSRGYTMSELDTTSYGDTSDIVNLFVISRITNATFLDALIPLGDNSIIELFSRNSDQGYSKRRVDADFAQMVSINSEVGLVKFSPEYYEVPPCDDIWCKDHCCLYEITNDDDNVMTINYDDCNGNPQTIQLTPGQTTPTLIQSESIDSFVFTVGGNPTTKYTLANFGCATNESPTRVLGTEKKPAIAIWFSSTTENLQLKDYLTPGRINFRTNDLLNNFPFNFGIKSQEVPFYQWETKASNNIFGTEDNNWYTKDFYVGRYQSLDRTIQPPGSYFQSSTIPATNNKDLYQRGYIFSVDQFGNYSPIGSISNRFIVGAPFQFYFGIVRGESAMDKFKKKYLADE